MSLPCSRPATLVAFSSSFLSGLMWIDAIHRTGAVIDLPAGSEINGVRKGATTGSGSDTLPCDHAMAHLRIWPNSTRGAGDVASFRFWSHLDRSPVDDLFSAVYVLSSFLTFCWSADPWFMKD